MVMFICILGMLLNMNLLHIVNILKLKWDLNLVYYTNSMLEQHYITLIVNSTFYWCKNISKLTIIVQEVSRLVRISCPLSLSIFCLVLLWSISRDFEILLPVAILHSLLVPYTLNDRIMYIGVTNAYSKSWRHTSIRWYSVKYFSISTHIFIISLFGLLYWYYVDLLVHVSKSKRSKSMHSKRRLQILFQKHWSLYLF